LITEPRRLRLKREELALEFMEDKMSRKIGLGLCCLVLMFSVGSRAYSQSRIEKNLKLDSGGRL